jgi:hypothetical protein
MARKIAFGTFAGVFATEGKHVAAVTTPVCADIGEWFESVGDTVVDLFFVISCVRFRDTFRYNLLMTLFMASVATIFTLITCSVEQKVAAEST